MGILMMGYDIEMKNAAGTRAFLEAVLQAHRAVGFPFTLFCVGTTVELQPEYFAQLARDPLVDIESHTYSHVLLKTVCVQGPRAHIAHPKQRVFRGGTVEQIEEELAKANRVLEPLIGRKVEGLTGPYGYYRGLCDRPDLLDICARQGLRFLRTWGRDHHDANPTPYLEPFFYAEQGHPDLLECPIHGYQDDFYYRAFCPQPHADGYKGHLIELAARIARENLTWSACSHDHVKKPGDVEAKLSWIAPFLRAARDAGVQGMDYRTYYRSRIQALQPQGA